MDRMHSGGGYIYRQGLSDTIVGCKLTAKISGVEIISLMLSRLSRAGTKNGRLLLYVSVNINNERMGSLYLSYQCFVIALLLLVSGFDQQERFPKV